jgi:hypothetical protein
LPKIDSLIIDPLGLIFDRCWLIRVQKPPKGFLPLNKIRDLAGFAGEFLFGMRDALVNDNWGSKKNTEESGEYNELEKEIVDQEPGSCEEGSLGISQGFYGHGECLQRCCSQSAGSKRTRRAGCDRTGRFWVRSDGQHPGRFSGYGFSDCSFRSRWFCSNGSISAGGFYYRRFLASRNGR